MVSKFKEQFHITDSTPAGEALLEENGKLREAMALYIASPEARKARVPDTRLLGAGRYSFTFGLRLAESLQVAVKISEPTSSQEAYDKEKELQSENLREQFAVLSALRKHLARKTDAITTPDQFFVTRTPTNALILVHELMDGWTSLEDRTNEVYGTGPESDETRESIDTWTDGFRSRLINSIGDFPDRRRINDLGGKTGRLHGGNLLVPEGAELNNDTPLCIIDQPGEIVRP